MNHFFEDMADWVKVLALVVVYAVIAVFFGVQAQASELELEPVAFGNHVVRVGTQSAVGHQKACVIYLEGLGDSIRNHAPLFDALSNGGYRVLAFDYYGQGGSSGTMNETRVEDGMAPESEIGTIAKFVWARDAACVGSKKLVIGWSTGGLAAYILSAWKWTDGVVLLAPGLFPKWFVGESEKHWSRMVFLNRVITPATLTRLPNPPHIDPVTPDSPIRAPGFARNLIFTSWIYRSYTMPPTAKGLVLLSGDTDSYVDRARTEAALRARAPHFQVVSYPGALHELDNELPTVSHDVRVRTLKFFDSIR